MKTDFSFGSYCWTEKNDSYCFTRHILNLNFCLMTDTATATEGDGEARSLPSSTLERLN